MIYPDTKIILNCFTIEINYNKDKVIKRSILILNIFLFLIFARDVLAGKKITIGITNSNQMSFFNDKGNPAGFYIDFLKYFAREKKWEIQFAEGTASQNIEKLKNNELDILVPFFRKEKHFNIFDFSREPILATWGAIFAKNEAKIFSILDIKNKKIAVQRDSHFAGEIKNIARQLNLHCSFYEVSTPEKVLFLEQVFKQAGVDCSATENVKQACWKKLVWNAPFNPLSVLGNAASTKEIMQNEMTGKLARNIMQEIVKLAAKDGCLLSPQVIDQNLQDTLKMRPYKTSMLLDFENKRSMEVEAILGNAYNLAQEYKLSLPYLETIYSLLVLVNQKF